MCDPCPHWNKTTIPGTLLTCMPNKKKSFKCILHLYTKSPILALGCWQHEVTALLRTGARYNITGRGWVRKCICIEHSHLFEKCCWRDTQISEIISTVYKSKCLLRQYFNHQERTRPWIKWHPALHQLQSRGLWWMTFSVASPVKRHSESARCKDENLLKQYDIRWVC